MSVRRRHHYRRSGAGFLLALLFALVVHFLLLLAVGSIWTGIHPEPAAYDTVPVRLVVEVLPPEEPEDEKPEQKFDGQLVDTPPPKEEERPEDYEFLAEHDRTVEKDTRDPRFRMNPEVLSEEYHDDDEVQFEDAVDLNVTEPSTGAQVGNDRFDPDRDGRLAALPSPFQLTNKDGFQRPVPASSRATKQGGAPNNDLLDVEISDRTRLSTRELIGAAYINRIRRLVNYYWKQNLDNLPRSVILARPRYTTGVDVVLDGHGALERIEVTLEAGSEPLDRAVVDAFRIAGPFPNPPPELIDVDGRIYLSNMQFTVELGRARAVYEGVDPRAGVRFPGLLNAPN